MSEIRNIRDTLILCIQGINCAVGDLDNDGGQDCIQQDFKRFNLDISSRRPSLWNLSPEHFRTGSK